MKYYFDNQCYSVKIIRKNNKNVYVRIKDNNIIYVTAPFFTTSGQIKKILDNNRVFLKKAILSQNKKQEREEKIFYLGKAYNLIISNAFEDVEIVDDKIFAKNNKAFEKWYYGEIKSIFQKRYDYYYERFEENIPSFSLKFRNMKTRWGVCNHRSKTITLNTRLLEYDLCCLDYVIVHELSHLLECNHSSNFWKVVEKYYPNYKKIRKMLKD